VKVGTGVITHPRGGLNEEIMERLVEDIVSLKERGKEVILVSSGAIGAGFPELGLKKRPHELPLEQASSSIGQIKLMSSYDRIFREKNTLCAQILLTREDIEDRERFLNARNTMLSLLRREIVPVVNENDTVATDEIRYGDNDILAGMVTLLADGELLIILTSREGLIGEKGEVIKEVPHITPRIKALVSPEREGKGGMESKIKVADMLNKIGIPVIIAGGKEEKTLIRIFKGEEVGTLFLPRRKKIKKRKYWIAYLRKVRGCIKVDSGARIAILEGGKSLLPGGVTAVSGRFQPGDTVSVKDEKDREFARGLVNYPSEILERIKGKSRKEIESFMGKLPYEEVIHRDNLLILDERGGEEWNSGNP